VGERPRRAREARGISLRQVSNVTRISIRTLEAVERNDRSRLPGGIFTRAFVRAYATEVGLDPESPCGRFSRRARTSS
jgi:cytoskeleton protein RodZ